VRREATLVPRFAGGPYGPGDQVEGVLVATEPERSRKLNAYLRYVDRSRSFSGAQTYDAVEPLHEGPVEVGQEIPFELRIPEDAYPNWDDPSTSEYGELAWSIVIESDVVAGGDTITTHSIPIDPDARWTGPDPTGERRTEALVEKWDVAVEPDRWELRRGEDLDFTLRIGKPKAERPKLVVAFQCRLYSHIETKDPGESYRREVNHVAVFEERPEFDPSVAEQRFTVTTPKDAPFSYEGDSFGVHWRVLAVENRRWYQSDAGRIAYLEVMP
jgi:hypothetical protein